MKFFFLFFLFIFNEGFSQKISWGIIGGFTKSYEFVKQNKVNIYLPYSKQKTTYNSFTNCFGFYTSLKATNKHIFELQVQKISIFSQPNQDSLGRPAFTGAKSITHNLNITLYYGYNFSKHLSTYFGIYDNVFLLFGVNDLYLYSQGRGLKYYDNTFGGAIKLTYQWSRLSTEGGFMYPLTPAAESRSTLYYTPTAFIQLKYKLSPTKKFVTTQVLP